MVEGFLNTSLAERKEFFDEATGVKQFQIKRDDALNKLRLSYENLNQAKMLLWEIEPRLKSLTRQVNKLKRRGELEAELKEVQLNYYSKMWHEIAEKFSQLNKMLLELEKVKSEKDKKLEALNREHKQHELRNELGTDYENWQRELAAQQSKKDALIKELALIEAKAEVKLEQQGKFDLSWLNGRKSELINEINELDKEIAVKEQASETVRKQLLELSGRLGSVEESLKVTGEKLKQAEASLEVKDIKAIHKHIRKAIEKIQLIFSEKDPVLVKSIAEEAKNELEAASKLSGNFSDQGDIRQLRSELFEQSGEKDRLQTEINGLKLELSIKNEQSRIFMGRVAGFKDELAKIDSKLKQYGEGEDEAEVMKEKTELLESLRRVDAELGGVKSKLDNYSKAEEEKRKKIFDLQRNIQTLTNEIAGLNQQISDLKISATRYETKLEDLEAEIRQNYKDLKAVKDAVVAGEVDYSLALEKIGSLKRQLDQIGGIDPEIEKEYIETKEKYDYLSEQIEDLMKAIESLETVIKELDLTIKERFDREFKIISAKFEEYFKTLFNGGSARIIKVMESEMREEGEAGQQNGDKVQKSEDDKLKPAIDLKKIKYLQKHNATGLAGVEIQATPPGKKIKTLAMLSGGERAMTAIALICAIISANPSPFVVLDEVDAALDEANSERLAKILDDLSHKTQFIVISHNRASMRRAQILYGVTMMDDGVSKLLSVKLEEAVEKSRNA